MVDVETEIVITCPCNQVVDYAANLDNTPKWYVSIHSVEWQTEKVLQVGAKVAVQARFMGRRLAYVYTIVEYKPGRRLVMQTEDEPCLIETTYGWEAINDRTTLMTLRNRGSTRGLYTVLSPLMAFVLRRANNKDLRKIKKLLEAGVKS